MRYGYFNTDNVSLIPLNNDDTHPWAEDNGEFTSDSVIIPAYGELDDNTFDFKSIKYGKVYQGAVHVNNGQASSAAMAVATGRNIIEAQSYVEGGNMLVGKLPNDETYALVGKDSVRITQALIRQQTGNSVTQEQVKAIIASDYGFSPENVHIIEQAGGYHIDLSMMLLNSGQVVLNDSLAAFEVQKNWLMDDYHASRPQLPDNPSQEQQQDYDEKLLAWKNAEKLDSQLEEMKLISQQRAVEEQKVVNNFSNTNLDVVRKPLNFMSFNSIPPYVDTFREINFANVEKGIGRDGKSFMILLGADDQRAEALIAETFRDLGVDRMYFLESLLTRFTLGNHGGIGCKVKAF